tara:strand:- start:1147 stop:1764 length:618 start_codon:yes stop_codon:yes gene_type:complete
MFIYLDESGDLGYNFEKRKTTKKFVITLLVCDSDVARKEFDKAVRRTLKNKLNRRKKNSRFRTELKGIGTAVIVKKYIFRNIKTNRWAIYSLILNKNRVDTNLQTNFGKKKLYNFLARFFIEKLNLSKVQRNVELIVDRCKNKEEVRDFNQYLVNQLEALLPLNIDLNISHLTSQESTGLQAVDLFSWGIFRKYENNKHQIIKSK